MELVYIGSRVAKSKANFALDKNTQLLVYKWLKSLCFPDRHASSIPRLVNLKDYRLDGMKSHDCHMFMLQTLILLAYQDLLLKGLWDTLTEIDLFFRDIYSNKLQTQHIKRFETNIVQTIYKIEMMFSLLFFLTWWSIYPYIYHLRQKLKAQSNIDGCIHSRG
jgi:hypothetical protein